MNKIILIQPPIQEFYLTRKRTIPYGLASIAASLEKQGFPTQILDALARDKSRPIDYPPKFKYLNAFYGRSDLSLFSLFHSFKHFGYAHGHMGKLVRDKQPFLVGISSLFTAYGDQALETARAVKQFYPQAYTVLGGHHPTLFPEETLACDAVDFVLRGEGEVSLPLLCRFLTEYPKQPELLEKIPGVAFRRKTDIFINPPAWIDDLDSIPLPSLEKINQTYYYRKKKAAITVVASRGCPMPCSYCSVSATSSYAKFRQRSVSGILMEIQDQAENLDIGFIDFEDENLTLNKNWALDLLSGIQDIFKGKEVELRAMNGLFPPSLDREILLAMKGAGFKTLNLSVGSFSLKQLSRFKRPDVRKAHDRVVDTAKELGLNCVSYIIGAAPGQTALSTLNDLILLAGHQTLAGLSIFYPAPGSLDYARCEQMNLLPSDFSLMRSTALPLDHTTSRLQAITLLRLARVLNFLKSMIDTKGYLPAPEPCSQSTIDLKGMEREALSEKLIQWFLWDGIIRGLDKKGQIYAHEIDQDLTQEFLLTLKGTPIMGVTQGPILIQ